ncbi:hypothetical protein CDAR_546981 [Caerostris darwini]|uniref:Secreted protein n=1 Tax=Caerostris darwini TaxID=1538125 RepID=A0AAV4W8J3_9ARAC|nr:hypothetical protein CDAR_546981 [Caerostris darwini]
MRVEKKTTGCKSVFVAFFFFDFVILLFSAFFKVASRKTLGNIRSDVISKRALVLCMVDYGNGHSEHEVRTLNIELEENLRFSYREESRYHYNSPRHGISNKGREI